MPACQSIFYVKDMKDQVDFAFILFFNVMRQGSKYLVARRGLILKVVKWRPKLSCAFTSRTWFQIDRANFFHISIGSKYQQLDWQPESNSNISRYVFGRSARLTALRPFLAYIGSLCEICRTHNLSENAMKRTWRSNSSSSFTDGGAGNHL